MLTIKNIGVGVAYAILFVAGVLAYGAIQRDEYPTAAVGVAGVGAGAALADRLRR